MAGTYTLTVTDSNGCTASATVDVVVRPAPAVTASSNSPVCAGGTLNLVGGPAGMTIYSWSGPGGYTSNVQSPTRSNATPAMAGTYTLTVTDSNGCTASATVDVVVRPAPAVTASSNSPVCAGGTLNLVGGPAGMTIYSWSGPGGYTSNVQSPTRSNATPAMAGTYTLTVTDSNGCTASATVDVVVRPAPAVTASSNSPVCAGGTLNLVGGPAGMTIYSWSGPGGYTSNVQSPTRSNATPAMAGTYTLTVTDSNGCTASATVDVVVRPAPAVTASSNSPVCAGGTLSLVGGPAGMTIYSWSGPGGYTSNVQSPTRSNATPAMAGTYTLTVTDSNGCSASATVDVVVRPAPAVTASNDGPVCVGEDVQLTGGPDGMASYAWVGPGTYSSNQQNPLISNVTPASAGSYTF